MSTTYIPVNADEWVKMVQATKLAAELMVENERLRKAGDRLASATIIFEMMSEEDRVQRLADWQSAKEGRDAK